MNFNTGVVLAGTGLLGLTAGVIGSFSVLRRRALIGDAIAHAALPGLCAAFLLVGYRHFWAFLAGALATGVLSVWVIGWIRNTTRIKEDAAIGIVLSVFFGTGIVLSRVIQNDPRGGQSGMDSFLFGHAAGMIVQDAVSIGLTAAGVLATVWLLFKEFKMVSFDQEFAAVQGWPVLVMDVLIMTLLAVTTVIGLPAVGVVLMAALLILPAAAARFWTKRLEVMVLLAGGSGAAIGMTGTWLSSRYETLPTGPIIVLVGALFLLVSVLFAPGRGAWARWWQRRRMREELAG